MIGVETALWLIQITVLWLLVGAAWSSIRPVSPRSFDFLWTMQELYVVPAAIWTMGLMAIIHRRDLRVPSRPD